METWPWSKYVSCLGEAAPTPTFAPRSSDLLCCFQIRSLCPGKLQSWFIGSNHSRLCPKAVTGSFNSSFSMWFCGLGFFIPPKLYRFYCITTGFCQQSRRTCQMQAWFYWPSFFFGKHLRLADMKLCCKWDTPVSAVKSECWRQGWDLAWAIHLYAWCIKNGHNPRLPSKESSEIF